MKAQIKKEREEMHVTNKFRKEIYIYALGIGHTCM